MTPLHHRVRRFASRHGLWARETRVIAALSGGSDSVALLLLLVDLAREGDLVLAGVAHLHHGIRGEDADADARFCVDLARDLGLPVDTGRVDVPALAADRHVSHEVAGRDARRAFLCDAARRLVASRIATAHTRDDQAETVLLRMVRGAGLRGISGIAPLAAPFARPLLDCARADLVGWLIASGQAWREDATNAELGTPRNRLRHEVLPVLRTHLNPAVDEAIARLADAARADEAVLAAEAYRLATGMIRGEGPAVRVPAEALAALPEALARRVARLALETAGPGRAYGLDDADRVREAAGGAGGGASALSGLRMERIGADVVLHKEGPAAPVPILYERALRVPGICRIPEIGMELQATGPMPRVPSRPEGRADEAVLAADEAGIELFVRSRRPGDRLRPLGMAGRKKLQDLFVDRKVPRDERDRVPVVVDAKGRIAWVAGHAVGDEFRVTDGTKAVVVLQLRRL